MAAVDLPFGHNENSALFQFLAISISWTPAIEFLNHNNRKTFIEAFIMYQTVGHILHLGFSFHPSRKLREVYEPLLTPSIKETKAERGSVWYHADRLML